MEVEQIEKRVAWLDDQRRKDAEASKRLMDRLDALEQENKNQARQLEELTSDLARLGTLSSRLTGIEESLDKYREDIIQRLDRADKQRTKREKVRRESWRGEVDSINKAVELVREELAGLKEIRHDLAVRKEEEARLFRKLDELEKRLLDHDAAREAVLISMQGIEESRKGDIKRSAELQASMSRIIARDDAMMQTLEIIEDGLKRNDAKVSELVASENEREERISLWYEQQSLQSSELEKGWKKWAKRLEEFEASWVEANERNAVYEETLRNLKVFEQNLRDSNERLDRRINETSEMQRLADDRMKHDWAAFQADYQKSWNTHKLTFNENWRDHTRAHRPIEEKLETLEEVLGDMGRSLLEMEAMGRKRLVELLEVARDWASEAEATSRSRVEE